METKGLVRYSVKKYRRLVMVRFHLKKVIADWEFEQGRHLTLEMLSQQTGIHRSTLSRIANQKGYNTTSDNIDLLCRFFHCDLNELVTIHHED